LKDRLKELDENAIALRQQMAAVGAMLSAKQQEAQRTSQMTLNVSLNQHSNLTRTVAVLNPSLLPFPVPVFEEEQIREAIAMSLLVTKSADQAQSSNYDDIFVSDERSQSPAAEEDYQKILELANLSEPSNDCAEPDDGDPGGDTFPQLEEGAGRVGEGNQHPKGSSAPSEEGHGVLASVPPTGACSALVTYQENSLTSSQSRKRKRTVPSNFTPEKKGRGDTIPGLLENFSGGGVSNKRQLWLHSSNEERRTLFLASSKNLRRMLLGWLPSLQAEEFFFFKKLLREPVKRAASAEHAPVGGTLAKTP
jgi:hypothetical protein